MKGSQDGTIVYSPSDLIQYLASPFASWMERYNLENPGVFRPDEQTADQRLIIETGTKREAAGLQVMRAETAELVKIDTSAVPPAFISMDSRLNSNLR